MRATALVHPIGDFATLVADRSSDFVKAWAKTREPPLLNGADRLAQNLCYNFFRDHLVRVGSGMKLGLHVCLLCIFLYDGEWVAGCRKAGKMA
jgi:hypothetical protein